MTNCPNCHAKLKGIMSSNRMYNSDEIEFINMFTAQTTTSLCDKCGKQFLAEAKSNYQQIRKDISLQVRLFYNSFPILTIQPPQSWEFDALGLVTAQTSQNNKVKNSSILEVLLDANRNVVDLDNSANKGELECMELLRQKTYALGGNAIVGIDVDYAEFGLKGELMLICMAGTAIYIKDIEKVNKVITKASSRFEQYRDKVDMISKFANIAT